jgi:hypothetical protein
VNFNTLVTLVEQSLNAEDAYRKALIEGKRIPELEPIILKAIRYAIKYAKHVIHGRWPELEHEIIEYQYPDRAIEYAAQVIKGKWPEAEPMLLESYTEAPFDELVQYAILRKERWPEFEEKLIDSEDSYNAYLYATDVIKDRWLEGEWTIKRNDMAWLYYVDFIKSLPPSDLPEEL